jgi:hypothetical protein
LEAVVSCLRPPLRSLLPADGVCLLHEVDELLADLFGSVNPEMMNHVQLDLAELPASVLPPEDQVA